MKQPSPHLCLIASFMAVIIAVPLVQSVVESRRGDMPEVLQVFQPSPTCESLAAFEHSLEETSVTARTLRPWIQAGQFFALREGGAKALAGRNGWSFYGPGVNTLTQHPRASDSTPDEAMKAVVALRDALATRGIRLIVVPVPNKESIYPDKLSGSASFPSRIINPETRAFFDGCAAAGVETVDLFALFSTERAAGGDDLYLKQDTHWSPAGLKLAARAVAARIGTTNGNHFENNSAPVRLYGDLIRMMHSPVIETQISPESIATEQITLKVDSSNSQLLALGDSFSRIFQTDQPHDAGFIAHLSAALGQPVVSLVNDDGSATLVRQELFRRPEILAGKRIVIWEFTERDLRLATEGWQIIPVP